VLRSDLSLRFHHPRGSRGDGLSQLCRRHVFGAGCPVVASAGAHTLTAHFDATAPSGTLTIGADGHDLASVEVPKLMLILGWTGLDIGRDSLSPVVDDYPAPFPFTGDINSVTFTLHPTGDDNDIAAIVGSELAKE
jgi:hypothetical protein